MGLDAEVIGCEVLTFDQEVSTSRLPHIEWAIHEKKPDHTHMGMCSLQFKSKHMTLTRRLACQLVVRQSSVPSGK